MTNDISRPDSDVVNRSARIPICSFALLSIGYSFFLSQSRAQLPLRVATHFSFEGQPDGWMSRSSVLYMAGALGVGLPALMLALGWLPRWCPSALNLPHRDYWLAAERREATFGYLLRYAGWFACLSLCFFGGLHLLMIQANKASSPELSTCAVLLLAGGFVGGTGLGIGRLFLHFHRAPKQRTGNRERLTNAE